MAVWYARDNSTVNSTITTGIVVGSVGWSAMTGWTSGASIAPGTLRRQSASTAVFTASQTTTTMTVSAMTSGTIYVGMQVHGPTGSTVTVSALGTGTGGTGTYTLNLSQSVSSGTWNGCFLQGNQRAFVATQSTTGTTGTSEPSWSGAPSKGQKFTDNTVTWIECTGNPAVNGDLTNTPLSSSVRSTAITQGRIITDNSQTHIFICSVAGTTGSGSPTFTTTAVGNTTTDSGVTWVYIGTSFSNWAAPIATNSVSTWMVAGDSLYVGDDHAEIWQNSIQIGGGIGSITSPCAFYSTDHTKSLPISTNGLKTGASIGTQSGSTNNLQFSGTHYWYGFTFTQGTGGTGGNLNVGVSHWAKFDTCSLVLANSSAAGTITLAVPIELYNTTVKFAATGQTLVSENAKIIWRNTPSAIAGATIPTTLFGTTSSGVLLMEGVDLSAITGTLIPAGTSSETSLAVFQFLDCKFASNVTIAATPIDYQAPTTDVIRCGSDTKTYIQRRYWAQGTLQEQGTIIRTGGASDGTTGISWNITTTATVAWVSPFECFPIAIWNGVTATNRTVTLHGIWNSASLPNNDDVWVDVEYLGDSGSPLASLATETKASNIASGSALTADSVSAWDSQASARQNSHAYSLGDVIKTSSNAGRIFFCTTAGTTAGSEPGGYAGAADGGSVTDSGAVFRAGTRFLLTVTLSTPQPQLVGYLRAYVKAAKVSSTFYVDPLIVLS